MCTEREVSLVFSPTHARSYKDEGAMAELFKTLLEATGRVWEGSFDENHRFTVRPKNENDKSIS